MSPARQGSSDDPLASRLLELGLIPLAIERTAAGAAVVWLDPAPETALRTILRANRESDLPTVVRPTDGNLVRRLVLTPGDQARVLSAGHWRRSEPDRIPPSALAALGGREVRAGEIALGSSGHVRLLLGRSPARLSVRIVPRTLRSPSESAPPPALERWARCLLARSGATVRDAHQLSSGEGILGTCRTRALADVRAHSILAAVDGLRILVEEERRLLALLCHPAAPAVSGAGDVR